MLKLFRGGQLRKFGFVALLIVAAFAGSYFGAWSWAPPPLPFDNQLTQTRVAAKTESQEHSLSWWVWTTQDPAGFYTFVLDILTGLVFVAGAFLSVYTYRLWYAGEKTLKRLEAEFVASHPPRIRIKHVSLESDLWHGEKIIVRTVIVNTGKTIAEIIKGNIQTLIIPAEYDLPNESVLREKFVAYTMSPVSTLPSGVTLVVPDQSDGRVLSPDDHVAIREGNMRLYVIGTIDYLDSAGRIKKTAYCRYLHLRRDATVADRGRLRVHPDSDYEYED